MSDVHAHLFKIARIYGDTLDEISHRLHEIDRQAGDEGLPDEAERLSRGINTFLKQYRPPGLQEKWDAE